MFLADSTDAPEAGAGGEPAFAEAEDQAAQENKAEAGEGKDSEESGKQEDDAGGCTGDEAGKDGAAGSDGVGHAAGLGTTEDGGDVLGGNGDAGKDGVEVELEVDDAGQHGHGKADGEIAEKDLERGGENSERDRARCRTSERDCAGCGHSPVFMVSARLVLKWRTPP